MWQSLAFLSCAGHPSAPVFYTGTVSFGESASADGSAITFDRAFMYRL